MKQIVTKPLAWFKQDLSQPRQQGGPGFALDELRALRDSLVKKQLVPLLCLADGTVKDGNRRLAAAMIDGRPPTLDAIVIEETLTKAQGIEVAMVTAMHRADLTNYEQALGCREWLENTPNATAKELAAKLDRDASMVSKLLSLWRCAPAVRLAAEQNKIGPRAWHQISLLPEEDQPGLLEMYLSGMSADQVAAVGKQKRNGTPPSAKATKFKADFKGCTVQVTGGEFDIAALSQLFLDLGASGQRAQKDGCDVAALQSLLRARAKDAAKKT